MVRNSILAAVTAAFLSTLVGCGAADAEDVSSGSGAASDDSKPTLEGPQRATLKAGESITFVVKEVDEKRKVELSVMDEARQTEFAGVQITFDNQKKIVKFHASLLLDVSKPTTITVKNLNKSSSARIQFVGVLVGGAEDLGWCRVPKGDDKSCTCTNGSPDGVCEVADETNRSSSDELHWMSADKSAEFGTCNGC